MAAQYDVVTFDCYGTLIDWESGIRDAFARAAAADGIRLDDKGVIPIYSAVEPVVERERYRRYRDVLTESAARTAHALGWPIEYDKGIFLAESLPSWKPFADTNRALERLKAAGIQLGILSNVDDDLLERTRKHFTVPFDLIITAQQVGSYKPAPNHFLAARARLAGKKWLHAAQSNFHDIVPANALGIPNAWINRRRQTPGPGGKPTYEFDDLTGLANAMT